MAERTLMECPCCHNHCALAVDSASGNVSGNRCENGEKYAKARLACDRRAVTGQLRVSGGTADRCMFRLDREVMTDQLPAIGTALKGVVIPAPVREGQILIADLAGTGANAVAADSVESI